MDIGHEMAEVIDGTRQFLHQMREMGEEEVLLHKVIGETAAPSAKRLQTLCESIDKNCQKCSLGKTRTNLVFGTGDSEAGIMFVGEAPGEEEDRQGLPFVGPAGQLLTKIIQSIKLEREAVYITNILKCRPPKNRDPAPHEIACCESHLICQIETVQPRVICALGRIAGQTLLKTDDSLAKLRSKLHDYRGIKLVVTYHPAALLRNPGWKRETWEDVKRLRREYDGLGIR